MMSVNFKTKSILWILVASICLFLALLIGSIIHEEWITSEDFSEFKHPIFDLHYNKYVDAYPLIETGEFKPKFCGEAMDRYLLTRANPRAVNIELEAKLQTEMQTWLASRKEKILTGSKIYSNLKYDHSQLWNRQPIDCYSMRSRSGELLFIRIDNNGDLFGTFNNQIWVTDSCHPMRR